MTISIKYYDFHNEIARSTFTAAKIHLYIPVIPRISRYKDHYIAGLDMRPLYLLFLRQVETFIREQNVYLSMFKVWRPEDGIR